MPGFLTQTAAVRLSCKAKNRASDWSNVLARSRNSDALPNLEFREGTRTDPVKQVASAATKGKRMNYLCRRDRWLAEILFSLALACEPSYSATLTPDSWENRPQAGELQDCTSIDSALIAPVAVGNRTKVIARLDKTSAIDLNQREMLELLGLPQNTPASATERIRAAIGTLEQERRSAIEHHVGSWSLATQDRLNRLQHLAVEPGTMTLRPFLVRAVAKYEGTGAFTATVCRDSLIITHESLGHQEPASTRLPVIVFLTHAPEHVCVQWSMAE